MHEPERHSDEESTRSLQNHLAMADFEYRAVTPQGRIITGVETATNEDAFIVELRSRGHQIVDVRPARPAELRPVMARRIGLHLELFGIPDQAIVFFTRQLHTTLKAGLPLLRALATLQAQASSPGLRKLIGQLINTIQQGNALNVAMSQHPKVFNDLYVSMIRIGEASGSLDVTVGRLADILERDTALRRKVRMALAYPSFVLVFSVILVYCLIAFLLPNFQPIFLNSGLNIRRDYPITEFLMNASVVVTNPYFLLTVCSGLLLAIIIARVVGRTGSGRYMIDSVKFYFPFLHDLLAMATVTRFCRTFGTMLRSGVPLLESLTHVGNAAGNLVVTRSIQRVTREIQEGERISVTLGRLPLFPPLLVQMATVGEETGTLDTMFERVADYYEQELEASIATLLALIEPLMMVAVGAVVCVFVMGVLLPIMGISAAYQKQM